MDILAVNSMISGPAVLLGVALVFTIGLSIANVRLHVARDPRIDQVEEALPAANCGACGYAGCAAFAQAVVKGEAPVNGCTVGGHDVAELVAKIMGVSFEVEVKTRPVIHCGANTHQRLGQKPYHGVERCSEVNLIAGVQGCSYGCLGFGDCVESCQFDALHMDNGLPMFNYNKCTSCGACVKACPRDLIELIPFKNDAMLVVACSSHDPARVVKQVCQVGCVGCGVCAKKSDVFGVDRNKAVIDYDKYENIESLQAAFDKCPAKCLVIFESKRRIPVKDAYAPKETTTS